MMMAGGAGVGGSERDTMRKQQLLVPGPRHDSNDREGHAASHSCVDPSDFMQLLERPSRVSLLPLSEEVLGFTDGLRRTRKDDKGQGGGREVSFPKRSAAVIWCHPSAVPHTHSVHLVSVVLVPTFWNTLPCLPPLNLRILQGSAGSLSLRSFPSRN